MMQTYLKLFLICFFSAFILSKQYLNENEDKRFICWRYCIDLLRVGLVKSRDLTSGICSSEEEFYEESFLKNFANIQNDINVLEVVSQCCRCMKGELLLDSNVEEVDGGKLMSSNRSGPALPLASKQSSLSSSSSAETRAYAANVVSKTAGDDVPHSGANIIAGDPQKLEESTGINELRLKRSATLKPDLKSSSNQSSPDHLPQRPRKDFLVPMFDNRTYHVTVNENAPPSTPVLLLQATLVDKKTKMKAMMAIKNRVNAEDDDDERYGLAVRERDDNGEEEEDDDDDDDGSDDDNDDRTRSRSAGTEIHYRLENDEHNSFAIDSKKGLVTIRDSRKLDYETTTRLRIMVIAEVGLSCDFATIWVHLRDVNDNSPNFPRDKYYSAVYEGLPRGSFVTQISAEDRDSGPNGRVAYKIVSGNMDDAFSIDPPNTGVVKTNAVLDREERDFYRLEVEAVDQGRIPRTGTAVLRIQVVDVNDNHPQFMDLKDIHVREATEVNSIVTQLMASDVDLNTTFFYSIIDQQNYPPYNWLIATNPTNPSTAKKKPGSDRASKNSHIPFFTVDRITGKLQIIKKLDRETFDLHVITVQISDGSLSSIGSLNIYVADDNDNPPTFTQSLYNVSVMELTPENSFVATIEARDPDANSSVVYELVGCSLFKINKTSGAIYTNQLIILNPGQRSHVIDAVVKATDSGNPPLSSVVPVKFDVVDVNDHPPVFAFSSYSIEISEDEEVGRKPVFKFLASDDDLDESNTRLFYSICRRSSFDLHSSKKVYGDDDDDDDDDDDASFFFLNSSTGELFVAKSLDREARESHRFVIKVSNYEEDDDDYQGDGCQGQQEKLINSDWSSKKKKNKVNSITHSLKKNFLFPALHSLAVVNISILDVNDNNPMFSKDVYRVSLGEDTPVDSIIIRLAAKDADANDKITYSIVDGNEDNTFHLHSDTGLLMLRMRLDYEMRTHYRLTIEAKDGGIPPLSSLCSVEVSVADVNEYRPIFNNILYIAALHDDAPSDTHVFTAQANDRDAGLYGSVHYKLFRLSDNPGSPDLRINPVTGQVRTTSNLTSPRNGRATFNYLVVAEDAGGLNATVNAVVTVELFSSKQKLRFENSSYYFYLPGNLIAGFVFGRVSVVPSEGVDNADDHFLASNTVKYYFLQDTFVFGINSTSGEIYLQLDLHLVSLSEQATHDLDDQESPAGFRRDTAKKDKRHLAPPSTDSYSAPPTDGRGFKERTKEIRKRSALFSPKFEVVHLTVIAEWDFPERGKTSADLKIDVDRSCRGCSAVGRAEDNFLGRSHLVTLLAFLLGILFVIVTVVMATVLRRRQRCKPEKPVVVVETDHATFRCSSINTTLGIPSPPPPHPNGREHQSFFVSRRPACPATRLSRTDEEVQLINNGFTPLVGHHVNSATRAARDIDGGGSAGDNKECGNATQRKMPLNVKVPLIESETFRLLGNSDGLFLEGELVLSPSSMESIHLFSEEGGGESDWLGNGPVYRERNRFSSGRNSTKGCKKREYFASKWLSNDETNNNSSTNKHNNNNKMLIDPRDCPSLPGFNQLVDCFPDYHSLSDVYTEIAKLKDGRSAPKTKPTKIVVSSNDDPGAEKSLRFYPPPILTDAPPICWTRARDSTTQNLGGRL